jgi:hypothetical protein
VVVGGHGLGYGFLNMFSLVFTEGPRLTTRNVFTGLQK